MLKNKTISALLNASVVIATVEEKLPLVICSVTPFTDNSLIKRR